MTAGKVLLLAVGLVGGLVGIVLSTAGGWLLWAQLTQRDADGYFAGPAVQLESTGYAVTTEGIDITGTARRNGWMPEIGHIAARVSVTPAGGSPQVFVGVASEEDLDRYLAGVDHAEAMEFDGLPPEVAYRSNTGESRPVAPTEQEFWVASAQGTGTQTLEWDAEPGRWAIAVMNADGSPRVAVTATGGVRAALLTPVAIALLLIGLLLVAVAAVLVFAGALRTPTTGQGASVRRRSVSDSTSASAFSRSK
jgi:hypothetical protein